MSSIVLAVALSLASTNDYVLTKPGTTNIVGVGMGEDPAYAFLRDEDISFLREAYYERYNALHPSVTNGHSFIQFPDGQPIPVDSFPYASAYGVSLLWPESFDTNDFPWAEYEFILRGDNPSYVPRDFSLVHGSGTPIDCNEDWILRPPDGTVRDLRKSYLAYLSSAGSRYRPPDTLHTNAVYVFGFTSFDVITNGYHNLDYAHTIVTPPDDGFGTISNRLHFTYSDYGYSATFTYTEYEYDGVKDRYPSGFDTVTPYDGSDERTYPGFYSGLPVDVSNLYVTDDRTLYLGWKRTGENTFTLQTTFSRPNYGPSYYDRQWYKAVDLGDSMTVWCDQITETNVSYCSNISAVIGLGFKWTSLDRRRSKYDSSYSTNNFTRCCYMLLSPELTRLPARTSDMSAPVVFSAAVDWDETINSVLSHFGEPAADPSPVFPDRSSVPGQVQGGYSETVVGEHYINNNVDLVWVRVLFRFDRDFHAKVLKENNQ